jgi:hypothetical protein
MVLLWQLRLADFPNHPVLEGRGLWQAFACLRHYPSYAFRTNTDTHAASGTAPQNAGKWLEPLSRAVIEPMLSVPAASDPRSAVHACRDNWSFTDDDDERCRFWWVYNGNPSFCIEQPMVSRVGGHPPWIQGPEEPDPCRECGAPLVFVGALGGSDTDILYGDSGYFYFFTCRATAKCPGLKNCTTVHQCC